MGKGIPGLEGAYHIFFTAVLIFLAVMLVLCLVRAIIGPRVADRLVAVNMMGTMVMVIIAILALMLEEGYLADICLRRRKRKMAVLEWVRFLAGAVLMLCGLGIFVIEMIGVFRFKYILNRMHAAAIGDTLGIGFSLLGLILMSGWNFTSLKLLFVIVFLWFASPVSSHLISRLEVTTDEEKEAHYKEIILGKQGEKNFVEETPEKAIEREDG